MAHAAHPVQVCLGHFEPLICSVNTLLKKWVELILNYLGGCRGKKNLDFPNKERRWFLAPPPGGVICNGKVWTHFSLPRLQTSHYPLTPVWKWKLLLVRIHCKKSAFESIERELSKNASLTSKRAWVQSPRTHCKSHVQWDTLVISALGGEHS